MISSPILFFISVTNIGGPQHTILFLIANYKDTHIKIRQEEKIKEFSCKKNKLPPGFGTLANRQEGRHDPRHARAPPTRSYRMPDFPAYALDC